MPDDEHHHHDAAKFDRATRRSILLALGIAGVGSVATSAAAAPRLLPGMRLAPTPSIDLVNDKPAHALPKPLVATANDILGPFWRAGAPFSTSIVPKGANGRKVALSGTVLDTDGKPVEGVILDFWNADDAGKYDLENPFQALMPNEYRYRGLVRSDANGKYSIETIVPGKYRIPPQLPGFESFDGLLRPSHIHLMTSHHGIVPLITQIYFAGDPEIAKDPWASKSKSIVGLDKAGEALSARFDIVLLRMG